MDRLDTLLGGDDGAMLNGWSQSAVDVAFDDVLGAALTAGAPLGAGGQLHVDGKAVGISMRIMGVNAPTKRATPSSKHKWANRPPGVSGKTLLPPQQVGKLVPLISRKVVHTDPTRQGPTQKGKCVWKQQTVMW